MLMLFGISEVLKEINALSSADDCNLVSIKELLYRLDTNITNHEVTISYLDELKAQGEIEDLSDSVGGWGRDKDGMPVCFGKIIRKL
ncbi:TPA: hypothetical protein NKP72_004602 [Vibrio parahaemolyticus]|nr:hypothetical protein [Vibrio parahaemolyticus]